MNDSSFFDEKLFHSSEIKNILHNINIPIAIADSQKKLVWASSYFYDLFNKDIIGKKFPAILKTPDSHFDSTISFEVPKINKIAKVICNESESGRTTYLIILEHKDSEIVSAEAEKKLIKNIAHDFNNIFTSILTSTELLKQKLSDREELHYLLDNIESNSNRASEIIDELLNGKTEPRNKINIPVLINDIVNSFELTLPADINLEVNIKKDLQTIIGNYSDIYRVVLNLCTNARESLHNKGTINISVSNREIDIKNLNEGSNIPSGKYVSINISDNGCGISEKNLKKIFETNFSTKDKGRESGLGLSIVKEIVEKHSGFVSVQSEANRGTNFRLLFPASDKKENLYIAGMEKTILVAEDEISIRQLLVELLESQNFNVIEAKNGIEVIEIVEEFKDIDLCILDRKMPLMGGISCIKKLREMKFTVPVLLVSGSKTDEQDEIFDSSLITRTLDKPYNFDELLNEIINLVS